MRADVASPPPEPAARGLATGVLISSLLHAAVVIAAWVWAGGHPPARPPVYRVELIGAPAGTRQVGVVSPTAATTPTAPAPAPAGAERVPSGPLAPSTVKAPPRATPKATPALTRAKTAGAAGATTAATATPPKAGSGRDGGTGADVRNLRTEGIAFPYPGYLNNIMRQITVAYTPRRVAATLRTEVKFLIRRDGSVADIEVVRSSGDRLFDLEAQGTVESVGASRRFGPLPSGWSDDVLVVYFTFDYALRP